MTHSDPDTSGGRLRLSRSRGALPGVLLVLLGAWGALIPLVGGYVDFGLSPDDTWNMSDSRWWFEVLPGVVVAVGGLLLLVGSDRIITSLGGWIAAAGGAWFAVGSVVQPVIDVPPLGDPIHPSDVGAMTERLALTVGLGVVIVFVAAWALGALAVVGVRDVRHARRRAAVRDSAEAATAAEAPRPESSEPVDDERAVPADRRTAAP